jgi:hypothetical protein
MRLFVDKHSFGQKMTTYYSDSDRCLHFDPRVASEVWLINGGDVSPDLYYEFRRVIEPSLPCPYCRTPLHQGHTAIEIGNRFLREQDNPAKAVRLSEELRLCTSCGFWRASYSESRGFWGLAVAYAAGVQRIFPLDAPEAPLRELFEYLRRKPERLARINPNQFEKVVGECFRATWGPVEAKYVGGPDDGGIDVVLVMTEGSRWLIQCKRRAALNSSEGVRVVRELLGTLRAEDELRGIVVSTADHFTYQARQLAARPNLVEAGYEIKLYDFGLLREMLIGAPIGPLVSSDTSDPIEISDGPWTSFFVNGWR